MTEASDSEMMDVSLTSAVRESSDARRIESLSSDVGFHTIGGWSALPSDWFGRIAEYLEMKEFYRSITCCRTWHANERRIPPLSFAVSLQRSRLLMAALKGDSSKIDRYRHVRAFRNSFNGCTRKRAGRGTRREHMEKDTLMSLYSHFPHLTSLQCEVDITSFNSPSMYSRTTSASPASSLVSLKSLDLSMTMQPPHRCTKEQGCHDDSADDQDENDVEVPWDTVRSALDFFIASNRSTLNSITLEYDLFQETGFAEPVNRLQIQTLSQLATPSQLTHLSITIGYGYGFEWGHSWSNDVISLIRSFTSLISLELPELKYLDVVQLFARPIPWQKLATMHFHGGSHELERYFQRCQKRTGWPSERLIPIFKHDSLPIGGSAATEPWPEDVNILDADFAAWYECGRSLEGFVKFPDGWAHE